VIAAVVAIVTATTGRTRAPWRPPDGASRDRTA
jgi:hypothetical protein